MHIAIDARLYGPLGKGLGRYIERLIENLEVIDTENHYSVLLCRENYDLYTPRNDRWKKICIPVRWYTLREQFVIPWVLWKLKPDLVHFPHFNVPLLISLLSPAMKFNLNNREVDTSVHAEVQPPQIKRSNLSKYKIRIPFVVTIHDLILLKHPSTRTSTLHAAFYWIKYLGYRIILRHALRHAQHIITVSNTVRNEIAKRFTFHASRSTLHVPRFTTTYEASDGVEIGQLKMPDSTWMTKRGITKPYFLYVGNAYPHKNLDFLLTWFLQWNDDVSRSTLHDSQSHQLVLVGTEDYFYKQLKKRTFHVSRSTLHDIVFFGYATESELADLYRHATLVVYPSLEEGFGLPPLEAMRYAVPVVVSDLPVLHEILGDAATYFNPRDPQSLTDAVASLEVELPNGSSTSASHRSEKIALGRLQVKKYSWHTMALQTLEIYNRGNSVIQ